MKDEDTVVRGAAISRKSLGELIVIVILLSFGINLLAGQLLNSLEDRQVLVVVIGIVLCLSALAYTIFSVFGKRVKKTTLEAFIMYNPLKKCCVSVPRYPFGEHVCGYIKAAFAENSALQTRWERQPLQPYRFLILKEEGTREEAGQDVLGKMVIPIDGEGPAYLPKDGTFSMTFKPISSKENDTVKLISEAIEYFLLEELSTHLAGYFNRGSFDEKHLSIYEREDIPSILLTNTFLELFSRPIVQRPAFVEQTDKKSQSMVSFEHGGSRYEAFSMILPRGSSIKRLGEHGIEIETKKVKIRFAVRFNGAVAAIPLEFKHYYLGYSNLLALVDYAVRIDIAITVKPLAIFSSAGWDYYKWVDSFLDSLEQSVSREVFFKRINWESTLTLLDCLKRNPDVFRVEEVSQDDKSKEEPEDDKKPALSLDGSQN